jgi:hypothetical protein
MKDYDWYSADKENKNVRRAAADKFLSDVLDNVNGIGDAVIGQAPENRKRAREEFDRRLQSTSGGGALPDKVEVICIEHDTHKMADLVVFVLYPKTGQIKTASGEVKTPSLWRKRWIAAWAPY